MPEEKRKTRKAILADFAKNVRKRRHELELTQEQLAEKADFHVNYIGGIERGERNPSLESIVLLARALKLPPKDLMPDS